ncbi:export ABC transporter ATP-binding protein [Amycolatopsis alba DSM 44262]|uniref:Export ABC transporter ATP-binding protein n=1 Tax=Amycolatopsis alba DSM 44262 TaxID=1125972 RepID=A0A229RUX5_AMYAL|nr:export ABC transporter ATP-binding protein [Amycolatopsis alba DSM 44262]
MAIVDGVIEVNELCKSYGRTTALDSLSFVVKPGQVTGFLGPNGAGKSTTMRIVLGLDRQASGIAEVGGRRYASVSRPLREVGALLDAGSAHPGRSAFSHLHCLARSNGIGRGRVSEVIEQVGIAGVANKRVGGFSLGMRQRLGIAAALLGDPATFLFDEPVNGLDPEGIRWIRELMRSLAAQGRTVLVSSHLMSEMALTADHVLIIGRGKLIMESSMDALARRFARDVFVRSPRARDLADLLSKAGAKATLLPGDALEVSGIDAPKIAGLAAGHRLPVHELTPRSASLEDAYLQMTRESAEYLAPKADVR